LPSFGGGHLASEECDAAQSVLSRPVYFNLQRYEEAIHTIHGMQNPTEGRRLLAASYGQLGRIGEARAEAAKVLQAHPDFSIERWAAVQPDKDAADVAHFVEGLRKAGF
jgi:adenylate cyclase